jgi:hypothetical protein
MNDYSYKLQEILSEMLLEGLTTKDSLTFYNILEKLKSMNSHDLDAALSALEDILDDSPQDW